MESIDTNILETERLSLRRISTDDSEFILELLSDPSFIRFIGDKGVKTLDDAVDYIVTGPMESYKKHGFGLYLVVLNETKAPIGMCGFLKRDSLEDVDIGFAFTPQFWGAGYATEATRAVMSYGQATLGLRRIVAITSPDNSGSITVLKKLGMKFEKAVTLPPDDLEAELFS